VSRPRLVTLVVCSDPPLGEWSDVFVDLEKVPGGKTLQPSPDLGFDLDRVKPLHPVTLCMSLTTYTIDGWAAGPEFDSDVSGARLGDLF
jgi:hypothetical protein